jgi:hypothetical protein
VTLFGISFRPIFGPVFGPFWALVRRRLVKIRPHFPSTRAIHRCSAQFGRDEQFRRVWVRHNRVHSKALDFERVRARGALVKKLLLLQAAIARGPDSTVKAPNRRAKHVPSRAVCACLAAVRPARLLTLTYPLKSFTTGMLPYNVLGGGVAPC